MGSILDIFGGYWGSQEIFAGDDSNQRIAKCFFFRWGKESCTSGLVDLAITASH